MSSNDATCGNNDGNASVSASGGSPGYTYQWSSNTGNQTTTTATGLYSGTYTVTVTDSHGCTMVNSVGVSDVGAPTTTVTNITNNLCYGDCFGDATVSASGGSSPYTYQWDSNTGNQTTATATGLCAGTYFITVSDVNNCNDIASITITEPSQLINNVTTNDVTCFGNNDGDASANVGGGTSPYTYNWSTNSTNSSVSNLSPGTYFVTVTDNNGCTTIDTIQITEPTLLTSTTSNNDVNCNGNNDGDASVNASGGTSPYSYSWSSGGSAATETGLSAGTYYVTVTDDNGCTTIDTVLISEPAGMTVTVNSNDANCAGDNNGDATVNVSGGTSPYSYSWSSGGTAATETGLVAGSYTITITDNNGCTDVQTLNISEPAALSTSLSSTQTSNSSACDGTATINVSGGVSPYTYLWDANTNNQTTQTADSLCGGNYCVTVTDNNGCTIDTCVDVTIGIEEQAWLSDVQLFPNPNRGDFTLILKVNSAENMEIYLLDMLGQKELYEVLPDFSGKYERSFYLDCAEGVYNLMIRSEKGTITRKVIIH